MNASQANYRCRCCAKVCAEEVAATPATAEAAAACRENPDESKEP